MEKQEIINKLREENPSARADDISIYADSFLDYMEASENITKNGNIVAHPRTGTPMENPYIKVKVSAINTMKKLKSVRKTSSIWPKL